MEDTAAYNEMFYMNCETFEELLTAIGPVISPKQLTEKLSSCEVSNTWSNEKNYHRLS